MRTQSICLALAIVLICPFASAQWVQTNGPYGGYITCFAVSGTDLFAGTAGGVFLSTNDGTSWTPVSAGLTNATVQSLATSGTNLFAGTQYQGVFRSTNNGTSWTATSLTSVEILTLAVFGTRLFAGTYGGLLVSTDNGTTWTWAGWGGAVFSLTESGANLFAGTEAGVCLSTDNGQSWTRVGLMSYAVHAVGVSGTYVFAGTDSGGVYLSTNNGATWTAANTGLPDSNNTVVNAFAVRGTGIFAGTRTRLGVSGDVFLSTNNGVSWTGVNNGLIHSAVWSLAVSGARLIAGTDCGVFLSADNGSTWIAGGAAGNPNVHISALSVRGAELFACTAWGGYKGQPGIHACIYHSTDNGDSWVPQLAVKANAFAMQSTDVFAGTISGVFRTTDDGSNWTAVNEGLPKSIYDTTQYVPIQCLASSGQKLFAGTGGVGVFASTNNGTSWTPVNNDNGMTNADVTSIVVAGTNVFAYAPSMGILQSTNSGSYWTIANTGLPDGKNTWVTALTVVAGNVFAGTYPSGGVSIFGANATSWNAANHGLPLDSSSVPPSYPTITSFVLDGRKLLAGSERHGLFLWTSNGTSWESIDSGFVQGVAALGINDTHIFAGTGYSGMGEYGTGLWRRPKSELFTSAAQLSSKRSPDGYALSQNYPNPFNPSTTIKFELPRAAVVTLSVFDILGREVSVLVNERRDAGVHEVKFDGSALSSGVYFYRIEAGSFVQTRRLLILR